MPSGPVIVAQYGVNDIVDAETIEMICDADYCRQFEASKLRSLFYIWFVTSTKVDK